MAVEGHARVTRIFLNALENTTRQNFSETTFTQFRAFGIVIFVQLHHEKKGRKKRLINFEFGLITSEIFKNDMYYTIF